MKCLQWMKFIIYLLSIHRIWNRKFKNSTENTLSQVKISKISQIKILLPSVLMCIKINKILKFLIKFIIILLKECKNYKLIKK